MSTAQAIINRAFSKIGVRAAETPLSSAEVDDALDVLNDLLASWDSTGTLTGVAPVSVVGDELLEPRASTWALKANLAVLLAGEYGIPISQSLAQDVTESTRQMIAALGNLQNLEFPSTLPIGSGNRDEFGTGYDRDFFPENTKRNF